MLNAALPDMVGSWAPGFGEIGLPRGDLWWGVWRAGELGHSWLGGCCAFPAFSRASSFPFISVMLPASR